MARRIWKFPLAVVANRQGIEVPRGAKFLSAQWQGSGDAIALWYLVVDDAPPEVIVIAIVGTGGIPPADCTPANYLATVQMGGLVWHLFETAREAIA